MLHNISGVGGGAWFMKQGLLCIPGSPETHGSLKLMAAVLLHPLKCWVSHDPVNVTELYVTCSIYENQENSIESSIYLIVFWNYSVSFFLNLFSLLVDFVCLFFLNATDWTWGLTHSSKCPASIPSPLWPTFNIESDLYLTVSVS